MTEELEKIPCPECGSSKTPALQPYLEDGKLSGYCFACDTRFRDPYKGIVGGGYVAADGSELTPEQLSSGRSGFQDDDSADEDWSNADSKEDKMSEEELKKGLVEHTEDYRGIRPSTYKKFGVMCKLSPTGEVLKQYYPYGQALGSLNAYKERDCKKKGFFIKGDGKKVKMFGLDKIKQGPKKTLIITEGELDALAVYQIMQDRAKPVSVVSSFSATTRTIKDSWEQLNEFETIIVLFDGDKAGQEAAKKIPSLFEIGKVKLAHLPEEYKDANELLQAENTDHGAILAAAFRNAVTERPEGIVLTEDIMEDAMKPEAKGLSYPWGSVNEFTQGIRTSELVVVTAGSGCVPGDTEFLTPTGWKRIDQFDPADQVGQILGRDKLEFVYPSHYYKVPSKGFWSLSTRRSLSMDLSPGHTVVGYKRSREDSKSSEDGFVEVLETAQEFVNRHHNLVNGNMNRVLSAFSPESKVLSGYSEAYLRLKVAVLADGCFQNHVKSPVCIVSVKKPRKIQAMHALLDNAGVEYDVKSREMFKVFRFRMDNKDKTYPPTWYGLAKSELAIIADEVLNWDGNKDSRQFYTSVKSDADFIQFVFSSMGFVTFINTRDRIGDFCPSIDHTYNKLSYTVTVRKSRYTGISGKGNQSKFHWKESEDGLQYCFTVPSSKLVLRCRDRIFISGNSGKTVFTKETAHHLMMEHKQKVGVFLLEEKPSKTLKGFAGMEKGILYDKKEEFTGEDKIAFRKDAAKFQDLAHYYDGFGSNDWDKIKEKIRYMVSALGVKYIFIDNCTALLSHTTDEYSSINCLMAEIAGMVIELDIHIQLVSHLRKSNGAKGFEQGAEISAGDMRGSSSLLFWAWQVIGVERNTQHEDPDLRNTSTIRMLKDRTNGNVGSTASLFYNKTTGRWVETEALPEEDF